MSIAPGTATIFCRACLDNPRMINGNDDFGIVDAILFTSRSMNGTSMISASLRFCKRETTLYEGVYDVAANVPFFSLTSRCDLTFRAGCCIP